MNEVICLAEREKIPIHYQDTDSMHIEASYISKLGEAFIGEYNRPLIASPHKPIEELKEYESSTEELGLFHGDFAGERGYTAPLSHRSVYCGKKMYMDELVMVHNETGEHLIRDHLRMKGVPGAAIKYQISKMLEETSNDWVKLMESGAPASEFEGHNVQSAFDFYASILKGNRYKIDLLKSGRPFFVSDKQMRTSTRHEFCREVGVVEHQRERAEEEAKKFGFDGLIQGSH
jgi:hypothetical protein